MLRSPLFWRLYLALALLVVLTATGIGVLTSRQFEEDLAEQIADRLRTEAAALVPLAHRAFVEGSDVQAWVRSVGDASGTRVTLVDPSGRVIADSSEAAARMDNHADRPELIDAFRDGFGVSRRFSDTVGREFLYAALRVMNEGVTLGAVRAATPLAEIDAEVARLRWQVARGAALAMLAALAVGVFVASRLRAPIAEMTRVSESLRRGDYEARICGGGVGELRTLGDNLNQLAHELSHKIDTLASQRAQLDAIIHSIQEGVLAVDDDDRVVAANQIGRELAGVTGDDEARLTGEGGGGALIRELVATVRRDGVAAHREITVPGAAGEIVLDARAAPFTAEHRRGVVLVLYDISRLRRLERVRTDFVANVSHELKTPLTAIHGYVETLLEGAVHDADNNIRFLHKIRTHVGRLSSLVSDLLSLARIESAPEIADAQAIDWRAIVLDSIGERQDPIARQRLQLRLELGESPVLVIGEGESARHIVDNLIDNAIAYTPEGGSLSVELFVCNDVGILQVADTGIGIPGDALDRVFERFYRVERGRSRSLGGTGLGLSIVRNLVRRMHGSVDVVSEVGKGSTFTVRLPLAIEAVADLTES